MSFRNPSLHLFIKSHNVCRNSFRSISHCAHRLVDSAQQDKRDPCGIRMEQVHLASASTRRAVILRDVLPDDVDVTQSPLNARERPHGHGLLVEEQVSHTLQGKIEAAQRELQHPYIIVADTLVADPEDPKKALGQPSDVSDALQMLLHLSGRRHRVWSGSAIICGDDVRTWIESATVEIEPLSDETLEVLIHSGSWRGKAGGYDLADAMGQFGKVIEGDEVCVLGFAGSLLAALAND